MSLVLKNGTISEQEWSNLGINGLTDGTYRNHYRGVGSTPFRPYRASSRRIYKLLLQDTLDHASEVLRLKRLG